MLALYIPSTSVRMSYFMEIKIHLVYQSFKFNFLRRFLMNNDNADIILLRDVEVSECLKSKGSGMYIPASSHSQAFSFHKPTSFP